jgi:1-acyl-sn-glycerol-3-phosphate acyltransferase
LLDIFIGISVSPGYLTLIPTRRRYAWGIPGVSTFVRLARFPLMSQTRKGLKADLAALAQAAERCHREEASLLVFPEGHRTKDGTILPFMTSGLRIVLSRARVPVYCIVGDGMWHIRTLADMMTRVAGSHIRVRILGPFHLPQADSEISDFLASLREQMIATLHELRAGPGEPPSPLLRDTN